MEEIEKKETEQEETVTMNKSDYDKAIQSAEDKLVLSIVRRLKTLEEKVNTLIPEREI